jgi:predicted PurR-regulated permease PerM
MGKKILLYGTLFIIASYFLFAGLVAAQPFLVPLVTAMVLAFLVLPIANKLEQKGWNKILATTVSTLALLVVVAGFSLMLFQHIKRFTSDWENIQEQLQERLVDFTKFLEDNTPLNNVNLNFGGMVPQGEDERQAAEGARRQGDGQQGDGQQQEGGQQEGGQQEGGQQEGGQQEADEQEEDGEQQEADEQEEDGEQQEADEQEAEAMDLEEAAQAVGEQVMTTVGAVFGFLADLLITFVYIFLFIHFRGRFREFILRFFPHRQRQEVSEIISSSSVVSRRYLAGRLFLMVILAVLYYTGLAISGLENALFIALISAALSIIPIVGNFIGYFIALFVSLLTNGEFGQIIGISLTFIIAQFIDTYILQPIVLGDKVDVHPFFIILTVILGNEVWGVMGMVLAIPLFAIITVVCRHVPALNPFGYLFSKKDIEETEESRRDKIEFDGEGG